MEKDLFLVRKDGFVMKLVHVFCVLFLFVLTLTSCSNDDYLNAVPGNSIAVVSVDMVETAGHAKGNAQQARLLKSLFKLRDVSDCGIDITSKLYFFESTEGNLGLVAKVSDDDELDAWLGKLAKSGLCDNPSKRGGCRFSTVNGSWVVGFNSTVMMVMGPVIVSQEAAVRQQILKYIGQDEDEGLKSSPLFDPLDSINAPVAMVAQTAALPEKMVAPFTLGAPKDAEASQILVAAGVTVNPAGFVEISGRPFSFNKGIDKALQSSLGTLRPVSQKYLGSMSTDDAVGMFLNVEGRKFIDMLHSNKSFQMLLAGINATIDMDNIIETVDGDMAIVIPSYTDGGTSIRMGAKLANSDFLADVPYWKQSCPKGGRIVDSGKNFYCYSDGSVSYYFGVTDDLQYYSGSTQEEAVLSIGASPRPLSQAVRNAIAGKRLCMVFNIEALLGGVDGAKTLLPVLKPLLGNAETVIYCVK